jgi:hypothetical protein
MAKTLAANQIRLNLVDLMQAAADPSVGGGVAAAIGSFYLRSGTGQSWLKTGAGNTAWEKLVQSFAWFSVKDYLAKGDDATDDTASIQAAINACATAGGGVVFFPYGIYRSQALTINAQNNVQLVGSGDGSVIRWTQDAALAAVSLLTIIGSAKGKITQLQFNGAGLTNPAVSRLNHLITIGDALSDVTDFQIFNCTFTGMVANSGDGIHVLGDVADPVTRLWVKNNRFDGCSRFGIGVEQGLNNAWLNDNFLTNCETEIAMVATAAVANTGIHIRGNHILHTSASERRALRVEGDGGTPSQAITVAENIVLGGFVTYSGVLYGGLLNNIQTSGAFASTDSACRIFGNVSFVPVHGNVIVRDSGTSVGSCMSFERSGGASPSLWRLGRNILQNEKIGGNLITVVDCTRWSIGDNICRVADATGTVYGIDIQAVTVALTDALIGPGNQFTAAAGSLDACVRLLSNGAAITDVSVVGNQGDNCDFGVRAEGGTFNGQFLHGTNNWDAVTGDLQQVGVTLRPNIGFNVGTAGTVGPQCRYGTGSPEGVISARIGSIYLRTDGGQATTLYYKETGTGTTGWVAVGGWPVVFGAGDLTVVDTAVFLGPGWIAIASAIESQIPITRPGTIRNLRVRVNGAGTDSATVTFTVRKNGVDQALVATINNNTTGNATDLVNSFTVVAGDLLSIKVTKTVIVTAGQTFVTGAVEVV